jgi:hypothetical protein
MKARTPSIVEIDTTDPGSDLIHVTTFARFSGLGDFRLFQQYRHQTDIDPAMVDCQLPVGKADIFRP